MASFTVDPNKKTTTNVQNPYDFAGVSVSITITVQIASFACRPNHLPHLTREVQLQEQMSALLSNAWEPP